MNLDSDSIRQLLPHRPPILILEAAEKVDPQVRGTGIRTFEAGDSFFQGHFPDGPVLPGIYIVEAFAQTAMVVMCANSGPGSGLLARVNQLKFLKPITPGQTVRFSIEIERRVGDFAFVAGVATCDGESVAQGQLTMKIN